MFTKEEFIQTAKKYNAQLDELLIGNAFEFAQRVHDKQKRVSGESYFTHPLAVALILLKKGMDDTSIAVGLLHDVVEDSKLTSEDLARTISPEVACLVEGVTKITHLKVGSLREKQIKNFRKLVLAMSKDIRVVIVKLADRLHNMRTLHFFSSKAKQKRIAQETMDIYVPLAECLGIRDWKVELEDISFSFLEPTSYTELQKRHHSLLTRGNSILDSHIESIQNLLQKNCITAEIKGRCKTLYSIWQKLKKYGGTYDQVTDLVAFRIIVDNINACYQVLGVLHNAYTVIPGRFKDYISLPKANGYQSLHTLVMGPYHNRIEIQIRTKRMNEIAESGVAAHWQYKQKEGDSEPVQQYQWIQEMLDLLSHASSRELIHETKMTLFSGRVFVFSKHGDVYSLMRGSCIIDFAYAVHSDIGNHCYSGTVNGRIVPLKTVLQNGDQVEIMTSTTCHPTSRWLSFVVTSKARINIRRYLRAMNRERNIIMGREMFKKEMKNFNLEYHESVFRNVLNVFNVKNTDELFENVGSGFISIFCVLEKIIPNEFKKNRSYEKKTLNSIIKQENQWISGLVPHISIHYARCCHPLPGDSIVGVVHTGRGVSIHQMNCDLIEHFEPKSLIDVGWQENIGVLFTTRVKLVCREKIGVLANLSALISQNAAGVRDIRVVERDSDFVNLILDLEVKNRMHFEKILQHLRLSSLVFSAEKV